jgi:hypothetical protein
MAQVRVSRHKAEFAMLPPVCVCCGRPSRRYRRVTLSMTAGSSFDSFLTALPEICQRFLLETVSPVLAVFFTLRSGEMTRTTIRAPVCRWHRHHWLWHRLLLLFVAMLALAALVTTLVYFLADGAEHLSTLLLACVAGLTLWLLVLVLQRR